MAHDCSDTPRSRARFAISASRSKMRSISPNTPKSEWRGRPNRVRRPGGPAPTQIGHLASAAQDLRSGHQQRRWFQPLFNCLYPGLANDNASGRVQRAVA